VWNGQRKKEEESEEEREMSIARGKI